MEYVDALRNTKDISNIKRYLKKHSERDYVLFVFGINTGLKITEMLPLQVKDVMDSQNEVKNFIEIPQKEGLLGKDVYVNKQVKIALRHYIKELMLNNDDYLFASIKTKQPISRQQAYRIIHDAAIEVGIQGKIGTNSMRKTFGYHAYKRGVAISLLQKYFHHSTRAETLKYLGISKDEVIKTEIDVNL
ncbi:tyrosine-type recombinase/integrase [Bacillus massiliigorillae]|uniref:tyrosine-type recombinase/integrase n=1 Tax=Bacillus massiliigorillae TaxID=1243664 RepID=UPI0003A3FDFA|nr:tyrosine-type recombinase/integrase [Bacillus massiliigorillae]